MALYHGKLIDAYFIRPFYKVSPRLLASLSCVLLPRRTASITYCARPPHVH